METGAVGLVLRLSRVMGIAPYPRGSRTRVSKALIVYGFILVTFISFYILSENSIYLISQKTPLLARDITRAIGNLVSVTLVLLGAYTAPGRMRRMARSLKLLEQINKKIPYIGAIPKDRTTFWVIVVFIFESFIIQVIDAVTFIFISNKNMRYVYYIISCVEQSLVVLLEMQVVAFAAQILLTLEMINKSLQHLSCIQSKHSLRMNTINRYFRAPKVAWEVANSEDTLGDMNNADTNNVNEDVLGTYKAEGTEYIIRQLSVHNRHICDMIRTWTTSDGLLMTLILLSRIFYLVLHLQASIMGFAQNTDKTLIVFAALNCIQYVAALLVFVEPFQRTHIQMERTSMIVQTLKCNCGEYQPVRNELDLFLKMLMLQKTSYSPLSMYTLGRPLVLKIFGGLITYLTVILTYGPEAKRPSLFFTNSF